jgi:3-deoxy-manno-octulosonate cytidylyltransferase (CMP-KDO synthetase)
MAYTVVIPARYGSTRLPGKPLLDVQGKPMVQRVWEQACASDAAAVVIATDDERIRDVASAFGARVCMTSAAHQSGTDRLQEVATALALPPEHILVNVQGDEPLIPPTVITQVADILAARSEAAMATLCEPLQTVEDVINPNIVKVVMDYSGRALYFSRAPIPWPRDAFATQPRLLPEQGRWYRHIGIYAYRAQFLHDYVGWPTAPQEELEKLEQLRALHNGVTIQVDVVCDEVPGGVDTQADLDLVREHIASTGGK